MDQQQWPPCPSNTSKPCSAHGECSHIGVCHCARGWGGEDCAQPRCAMRCSGHGHCPSHDPAAACICDEGFTGYDCDVTLPSPTTLNSSHGVAIAPPAVLSSALTLNITSRLQLSSLARPLTQTLPVASSIAYWSMGGSPPQIMSTDASSHLRVFAALPLCERESIAPAASALQAEPLPLPRQVVASSVDWRLGRAYLSFDKWYSRRTGLVQVSLPSMDLISVASVGSLGMDQVTSIALGGEASESTSPPTWLHVVLASAAGTMAELAVVRIPEMQTVHTMRLKVASPVRAAHFDARTAGLFMLSAFPSPRLMRVHMMGGVPAGPPGRGDAFRLPWQGALPILLPFPGSRLLVALSDSDAEDKQSSASIQPPRLCRWHMGLPLDAPPSSCAQLHGKHAMEHVTTAAADDITGVAYLGCRSGALLRVRISPLRVDAVIYPTRAHVGHAVLRPSDGALWLSARNGELIHLETRTLHGQRPPGQSDLDNCKSGSCQPQPSPPPPALSRFSPSPPASARSWHAWFVPWLASHADTKTTSIGESRVRIHGLAHQTQTPASNDWLMLDTARIPQGAHAFWIHHKIGLVPTILLAIIAACCGGQIGSALFRFLYGTCARRPSRARGFAKLP